MVAPSIRDAKFVGPNQVAHYADAANPILIPVPGNTEDGDRVIAYTWNTGTTMSPVDETGWALVWNFQVDTAAPFVNDFPWEGDTQQYISGPVMSVWERTFAGDSGTYAFESDNSSYRGMGAAIAVRLGDQEDRFTGWNILVNFINLDDHDYGVVIPSNIWEAGLGVSVGGQFTTAAVDTGYTATLPFPGARLIEGSSDRSSETAGDETVSWSAWGSLARISNATIGDVDGSEDFIFVYPDAYVGEGSLEAATSARMDLDNTDDPSPQSWQLTLTGSAPVDATADLADVSLDVGAYFTDDDFNEVFPPVSPYIGMIGVRMYPLFSTDVALPSASGSYAPARRRLTVKELPYDLRDSMRGIDLRGREQ